MFYYLAKMRKIYRNNITSNPNKSEKLKPDILYLMIMLIRANSKELESKDIQLLHGTMLNKIKSGEKLPKCMHLLSLKDTYNANGKFLIYRMNDQLRTINQHMHLKPQTYHYK